MNWPDFTKRSSAIVVLLALDVFFFLCTFTAYMLPHAPDDLRKLCAGAFGTASGMLALALKMGGPDTPTTDDTAGTVQQTTIVTPTPEVKP